MPKKYVCEYCNGMGKVDQGCDDPQCGDSTWDHYCNLGSMTDCPACTAKGFSPFIMFRTDSDDKTLELVQKAKDEKNPDQGGQGAG